MENAIYSSALAGTFFLLYSLLDHKVWKSHPAFFAYVLFSSARMLVLYPVFRTYTEDAYSRAFWGWEIASLAFLGAAAGELVGHWQDGAIYGSYVALASASLLSYTRMTGSGSTANLYLIVGAEWASVLIASLFIRGIGGIASGLVVFNLIGPITLLAHGPYRFARTFAWIVALFLWIDWVRTYRAESAAITRNSTLRSSRTRRGAVFSSSPAPCK